MAKMTKTQKKRAVKDILSKSKKLFMADMETLDWKDMGAIEKLCKKWLKRIG